MTERHGCHPEKPKTIGISAYGNGSNGMWVSSSGSKRKRQLRHKSPIRLSPMIRTTRAFFHPTHLAVHVSLLGFKLGQNAIESIRFFLFGIFSFLPLLFLSFSLQRATITWPVAKRQTWSCDLTRLDSTRLCPALPLAPTELDANRK